jgi:hypothetical protein
MGAMLVCWVVFPAVLGAISLGCGLALEKASGRPLPGSLLLPAGFAVVIALAGLPVLVSPLARVATPLVVAVAALGLVFGRLPRGRRVGDALALGVILFVIYGAPVLLSGEATFLGYNRLDDTSTWLGITDLVMHHGRSVSGLAPSTYEYVIKNYVGTGYPVGAFLPMGIGHVLVRQDVAWLFQPTISFMGAMLGLSLYGMTEPLVRNRARRAAVAAVGAAPALLIGYAWWGSIKEVAAAALIALVVVLGAALLRSWPGLRGLLPLAVAVAAIVGVLSAGGIVWVLPALVVVAVALLYRRRHEIRQGLSRFPALTAVGVAIVVVLLLPALGTVSKFAGPAEAQFSTTIDLGILSGPLSALHAFGIWPSGDLRTPSVNATATDLLIGIAILAALGGVAVAWRRRAWALPLYAFTSLVAGAVIFLAAGPWVAAKALALASAATPFCALAAAGILYERGRRLEGAVLAIIVAGGVLWSNVLQYHAVYLAPRDQLVELQHVGNMVRGQGPILLTSPDHFGARHFLRLGDPESLVDLHRRTILLNNGSTAPAGISQDLDAVRLSDVLVFPSIVERTSPVASRPPLPYRLVWHGRFYELWQRPTLFPRVIAHLSLGNFDDPGAVPSCAQILSLARAPGTSELAYVPRDPVVRLPLADVTLPPGWTPSAQSSDIAYLHRAGQLEVAVQVPRPGAYRAWVGNSFRAHLEVLVDGHDLGGARQQINVIGQYTPFGTIPLKAGRHLVALRYSGPDWRPGSGGAPPPTGPVVLSDQTADLPVSVIAPSSARSLCGRRLDWVEALGR